MFIDIIGLVLLVWATFKGLRNGFVVAVFSFLAFIIGLAAALKLSTLAADYLGSNTNIGERWLPFIAFAAVFLIVVLLVRIGAKAIEGALRLAMLGWLNRLGGIIFYLLIYFFIYSVLLFYAQSLNLIKPETTAASVTYPFIQPIGPKIMDMLGAAIPFFKNMFEQLLQFFGGLSREGKQANYSLLPAWYIA